MSFPDHGEPSSGYEELSFGSGDPDREPRLQLWLRAHARLLAVCAAVLVVFGAAGAGGWYLYERSLRPLPPPDAAFPEPLRFWVSLCGGYGPGGGSCPGRPKATEADYRKVADRMRAMPELAEVVFKDETMVRRAMMARYTAMDEQTMLAGAVFAPSLTGTLRRSGDFAVVAARLKAFPEVETVLPEPSNFWAGKADLEIVLCAKDDRLKKECVENRPAGVEGAATEAEKEAVVARLWDLPGAETIYLQDRGHLMRLMRHHESEALRLMRPLGPDQMYRFHFGGPRRPDQMYETFYVKLSTPIDPTGTAGIARALKLLPGVLAVYPVEAGE
ncbi:hypothetical protein [Planomonospora venezuelensis]|uniref:FtsX extracellular domain-containing protein n=1 Tax=Planomonospora venezuelensis TaxID=1999 RepID=A0A841CW58_PLAVE|nr:hypothetical protein [Planomonospora venezuelensis]MBB5962141.1 hypothetical protein [Planomonospora venezuelensis]GIN00904.1 hypothetical protein Pve01_25620 [Planomonospora venezuelensis]